MGGWTLFPFFLPFYSSFQNDIGEKKVSLKSIWLERNCFLDYWSLRIQYRQDDMNLFEKVNLFKLNESLSCRCSTFFRRWNILWKQNQLNMIWIHFALKCDDDGSKVSKYMSIIIYTLTIYFHHLLQVDTLKLQPTKSKCNLWVNEKNKSSQTVLH